MEFCLTSFLWSSVMWEDGSVGAGGSVLLSGQDDVPSLPQVSSSLMQVQATFAWSTACLKPSVSLTFKIFFVIL